jgi:hypothetical protein
MMILDFVGLFGLLAGFIIGLGAVTVVDIHGFLGRTSTYWTDATTRTHKVTKPLIWAGMLLAITGGVIFFRHESFVGLPLYLSLIATALILNGLFLSFWVSPYLLGREKEGRSGELLPLSWQRKIVVSLLVSDFGWWGALALIVYFLVSR